jgi:hypothetical protein
MIRRPKPDLALALETATVEEYNLGGFSPGETPFL